MQSVLIRGNRLVAPYQDNIAALFPNAKPLQVQGKDLLVLDHGIPETIMLRRFGLNVPAPVYSQYDWAGGTPFDVQRKTVAMMTTQRRAYVLNGLGTGKTKSALWAYDYLRGLGYAGKMLVLAPLSTLRFTWEREIFETVPHLSATVLLGPRSKRLKLLDQDADIYIVNHDGLQTVLAALEQRPDINALCIDELAVYRNGQATRTKTLRKFAATREWVWGMTGSPIPRGPEGAWAQATIITPHTVPKYFKHWREAVMDKVSPFTYKPKATALDTVAKVLQPAVRYTLDDVLELPECVERYIDVPLGPMQAKIYKQMRDKAIALVEDGEITAMNAGAVLSKLLQISCGWVYNREGRIVALDPADRLDMLQQCIDGAVGKVLVFVPFKHALAGVEAFLTAQGVDHAPAISGDTPARVRSELFSDFQGTSKYQVLPAHPQCLAHGLTLTAADTVAWFAPHPSLEIYQQANGRVRRIGQKRKQQILHLQSTAAERKVYRMLAGHEQVQAALLDIFAELTE